MSVLDRPKRLSLILEAMAKAEPVGSEAEVHVLMEAAFDEVEDAHSGVEKALDPSADQRGRMYPPHPDFRIPGVQPSTFRHRGGHRTVIGANGSFRILRIEADLNETVIFEKRGADGKGYWED